MEKSFNLHRFKAIDPAADQYERQLRRLIDDGADVTCIEKAVQGALKKPLRRWSSRVCNLRRTTKWKDGDDDMPYGKIIG